MRQQYVFNISYIATQFFKDILGDESEYDEIEIDENYEIFIRHYGNREKISLLSGGEQVAACLAIRIAIAHILGKQDLLLIDEPTVHLDDERRNELVDLLGNQRLVAQTIVVTHDDEFKNHADRLLRVNKKDGASTIEITA